MENFDANVPKRQHRTIRAYSDKERQPKGAEEVATASAVRAVNPAKARYRQLLLDHTLVTVDKPQLSPWTYLETSRGTKKRC
jgi:hypothetical protein